MRIIQITISGNITYRNNGLLFQEIQFLYINNNKWPEISKGEQVRMILPKNITITPYLRIEAPAGLTIDIRTDNYKGGSENNVRTAYVT